MKRFPRHLYVKREVDGDTTFFVADKERDCLSEKGERTRVATYALVEVEELEDVTVCRGTSRS